MEKDAQRGFNFEKLEVWQRAVELVAFVYEFTRKFPTDERFGITSQMRRAVLSISSNLAEGSSRSSRTDFARFVESASGSLYEFVSQAFIARNQEFLGVSEFEKLTMESEELSRMLSGLRN